MTKGYDRTKEPDQFIYGTLHLPTPKDGLTPATYPLGAGSEPTQEQQDASRQALENEGVKLDDYELHDMPPVNSDNYQAAAAADKGSEIKGSAETKLKSSEAQETEKKEKEQDKAKFQTGHTAPSKK
jgi:hypothetical protein